MSIKTHIGSFVAKSKLKPESDWVQCTFVKCDAFGNVPTSLDEQMIISAYADKTLILTKGQVVVINSALKGDEIEIKGTCTLGGKEFKSGDKYKYDKDSTRVTQTTFDNVHDVASQLDRESKERIARIGVGTSRVNDPAFQIPQTAGQTVAQPAEFAS